jgi:hypothetical protein
MSTWPTFGRSKALPWRGVQGPQVAKLLPLFRRQDAPGSQQHFHLGFFQLGSRLGHFIDLCEQLRFVGRVGLHLEAQDGILLFQVGAQVNLLDLVILRDFVEFPDLVVTDMELLHENGILPPFYFRAGGHARRAGGGRIHHRRGGTLIGTSRGRRRLLGHGMPAKHDGKNETDDASFHG